MISRDLIHRLHCPYCGSHFTIQAIDENSNCVRNGILQCACYRYPIVENIAILRQQSDASDTLNTLVAHLERRNTEAALQHALSNSQVPRTRSYKDRLVDLIKRSFTKSDPAQTTFTRFSEALALHRPAGYAEYLFHRYANNSFLAAIPLMALLKEFEGAAVRVLDLNCGVGHASFLMQSLFPNVSVIATDHDYTNLHLARQHIVPEQTVCLCLDAELPLPFEDKFLDVTLCMDGLHYIRSKCAIIRELDRVMKFDGIWLFAHMHNATANNVCAGIPLKLEGYARCFDFLPFRIYDEAAIFAELMRGQMLDLDIRNSGKAFGNATAFSLVASRRHDIWRTHDVAPALLSESPHLSLNPIYQARQSRNGMQVTMAWPNTTLESECDAVKQFFPNERFIGEPLWQHLQQGDAIVAGDPTIQDLIRSCVVVRLPRGYA